MNCVIIKSLFQYKLLIDFLQKWILILGVQVSELQRLVSLKVT